jgi:short-subunit dehydrogenase
MAEQGSTVIIGGTSGLGLTLAKVLAGRGDEVVITGRDPAKSQAVAKEIGGRTRGLALDLANPSEIAGRLGDVRTVKSLVITAIERGDNSVRNFDFARA